MHQATNICAAAPKKSSPASIRKEKTKERDTPDSPLTKATYWKTKSNVLCAYCKAKGHVKADCWKVKRKENASQDTSTGNIVAATKDIIKAENMSIKD